MQFVLEHAMDPLAAAAMGGVPDDPSPLRPAGRVRHDEGPGRERRARLELSVVPSFGWPRGSDDEADSESPFATARYHPTCFEASVDDDRARRAFGEFLRRLHHAHRHGDIAFLMPADALLRRALRIAALPPVPASCALDRRRIEAVIRGRRYGVRRHG